MSFPRFNPAIPLLAFVAAASSSFGAVVWSGNGNANASGTWETADNWNPAGIPDSSASVQLNDVTAGTRTVTISAGSPQTIGQLAITQSTAGAINRLDVNDNLTISSASAPLTVSAATASGVVINVAAGKTFLASRSAASTAAFGGTLNLLGTGSTFSQTSTAAMTASFSGPIQAAAGSSLQVIGTSASLSLAGASEFGAGSSILLRYTATNGAASFSNSGTLSMDGATLIFDWVATGSGGNVTRNYINSGTWTLKNNSSLVLTASSGNMPTNGGFSNLVNNENTGTLNLESGSSLTSRSFFNTGTLNLGSSTTGTSDAQVSIGGPIVSDIILTNGLTAASVAVAGTINIKGNTLLGRATSAASTIFNNGAANSTGSVLNIGDGTTSIKLTLANLQSSFNNFSGNTVNLRAAGTLALTTVVTGATTTANVSLTNNGTLNQAGTVQFNSNSSSGTRTFANTGIHAISGTSATIEALPTSNNGNPAGIAYTNSGRLSGSSSSDKLTYVNSSGYAPVNTLLLGVSGEITPGNGSNGSGVSSIGSLGFENINVTLSGAAKLTFDIGGSGAGLFDTISLTGTGGVFALGSGSTLDIRTVNGATPTGSYLLLSANSVTGNFASLLYNGSAVTNQYTVTYLPTGVQLDFGVIPEPSAASLLLGGLGVLAVMRRRKRA